MARIIFPDWENYQLRKEKMQKSECANCGKPLFDQEVADPESGLCDTCWLDSDNEKENSGGYDDIAQL